MLLDPFLSETLKNPLSASFLIIVQIVVLIFVILKLNVSIIKDFTRSLKVNPIMFSLSIILFIFCCFHIFYRMTDVPPAGLEHDDGFVTIAAYLIKHQGHDSTGKMLPYYPFIHLYYHNEQVGGLGQRGVPVYYQAFLQYFVEPGHFSIRLEGALLMLFTGILLIYTFYLLKNDLTLSLLCGSLLILMPWTRTLAKATPETTAFCFASSAFLFSVIYLLKNKNFLGVFNYLICLAMLFLAYTPGLMLGPLCAFFIPFIIRKHSDEYKSLSKKLFFWSLILLGLIYFGFHNEIGFKWNLERAQGIQGVQGITEGNINKLVEELLAKSNTYIANFFAFLLPDYLFIYGDQNMRHNTRFGGQLFTALCIAFYVGLIYIFERRRENLNLKLLFYYLLLACIPASLCLEGEINPKTGFILHAFRSSCMLPPLVIICVLGLTVILNKNKVLFLVYSILITVNVFAFYSDYFNDYPKRLELAWHSPQGLRITSKKACEIMEKHPSKKLFFYAPINSFPYHNLKKIGLEALIKGNGLLSNVYEYSNRGSVPVEKGDLFLAKEPFDYNNLNRKIKYIMRVRNPYLPERAYGASLFEITEEPKPTQ